MAKKAKKIRDPRSLALYRARCARNGERALNRFIWNANRVAGVLSKDKEDVVKAKFVTLLLTGTDQEKILARARLKDFD